MTRAALLLCCVIPAIVWAQAPQQGSVRRGAEIFAASCTAYCHAPAGGGGGAAPRLAARGFDEAYINTTVSNGVPGTPMPGFSNTLSRGDLAAVVAYVAGLNGIADIAVGGSALQTAAADRSSLSADAERGRQLFSDAVRGLGRCSTCHEVNGIGIPVTTPIAELPADASSLQRLATPRVVTASAAGDTMPALVVSNGSQSVIYYDLTAAPPVLRTTAPGSVKFADGSTWRHASVIGLYTDGDLELILKYLRAIVANNAGR
jgi:mono/diheme cytochrome c family protein